MTFVSPCISTTYGRRPAQVVDGQQLTTIFHLIELFSCNLTKNRLHYTYDRQQHRTHRQCLTHVSHEPIQHDQARSSSFNEESRTQHGEPIIIMQVYDTPEAINAYRNQVLLRGLMAEVRGMQLCRGRSCYAVIKEEFGLKGNKQKVLDQFKAILNNQ